MAPCAFDALSAKAIEACGFLAAGTAVQGLPSAPDNGLLSLLTAQAPLLDTSVLQLYRTRRNASCGGVAATVDYLACPDASFVTGAVYHTASGRYPALYPVPE